MRSPRWWIAVIPIVLLSAGCSSFEPPASFCTRAETSWNEFATTLTLEDVDLPEALRARDALIADWEQLSLRGDTPKDLRYLLGAMSHNVRSAWVATNEYGRNTALRSLRNGLESVSSRCHQADADITLRHPDLRVEPPQ